MEENNNINSPRTLKIELPVVENHEGHDEDDDEEEVEHKTADKNLEQEGETQHGGGEGVKSVENPGGDKNESHLDIQKDTEDKRTFLTDKDDTHIESGESLEKDKHVIGHEEKAANVTNTAEVSDKNLKVQESSLTNSTNNQNKETLNLQVTHSANDAKIVDHSDTETVLSYDPTGTHIVEYNENQSYAEVVHEIELKKNEDSNTLLQNPISPGAKDTNGAPSDFHKQIERPSDTIPRPVKHKRKQQLALTEEEEELGIYEDTAEGDDLTDTELEVMKNKFRKTKLHKEYEKVLEEAELMAEKKSKKMPIIEETITIKPIAEAVKQAKPTIRSAPRPLREMDEKCFKEFKERLERGKTAVSCIAEVFQESRFVSNIHKSFLSDNIFQNSSKRH